jgi:mono/diheme cytochrome c family protein/uncharacterized membrane protein
MRLYFFVVSCVLGTVIATPLPARGDSPAPTQVLEIFKTKCAGCHGPDVPRPRGGFDHVLDLKRIASNPTLVIPSHPEKSELWTLLDGGEMPPPDSPAGPLTSPEKALIRAWIAGGAPTESRTAEEEVSPSEMPRVDETPIATPGRTLRRLGKLHLLLLHFPIALLLAGAAGEVWYMRRRSSIPSEAVRFCIALGATAAVPSVALGWVYASSGIGSSSPDLLELHRWVGTAAGAWAIALAIASEAESRRGVRTWRFRVMLLSGVLLVSLTAHLGGLLAHGADFFVR